MKKLAIGIFYGESFFELSAVNTEDNSLLLFERFYSPRNQLKNQILNFITKTLANLSELNNKPVSRDELVIKTVVISSRFLEKIFSFKLGGTVAQLVSEGFEKWLLLHQKTVTSTYFKIELPPEVSSEGMTFSVKEKINFNGQIETPLENLEIKKLVVKLKNAEAKRVCLHLINSDKNDSHLNALKAELVENGFEVYTPKSANSYPSWRLNLLEASTSGTFNELNDEIIEAFSDFKIEDGIFYLNHQGELHKGETGNKISSLFSIEKSMMDIFQEKKMIPTHCDIFHFGMENFSLIKSDKSYWKSPWGITDLLVHERKDLRIQPTNSFYLNSFEEIEITKSEETFEPGPMSFERGRVPCVFDVLNSESVSKELNKKIKDTFWALVRSSSNAISESNTFDQFREIILNKIISELYFLSSSPTLVIYGYWAEKFFPEIKKKLKNRNLILIKEKQFPKSYLSILSSLSKEATIITNSNIYIHDETKDQHLVKTK